MVHKAIGRGQPAAQPGPRLSALLALPSNQHAQADIPPQAAQADKRKPNSWLPRPGSWLFRLLYGGLTLLAAFGASSAGRPEAGNLWAMFALILFFGQMPRA